MKNITLVSGLVIAAMSIGLVVGCGGSSSEPSGGGSAALDTQSIDKLGKNAAEIIPGCVYTGETVATTLDVDKMVAYRVVFDNVVTPDNTLKKTREAVNETVNGSCGGTMTTVGTHDNGDTDAVYTFTNYCTGDGTNQTTLNGTADVVMDGDPSPDGPVMKSVTISTGSSGISTTTVAAGETSTETVYLDTLKYTVGTPSSFTAKEIKVVSSMDGTYRLTNVNIEQNGDTETGTVQIKNATYYDPDIGAVSISTSAIPMGDTASGAASITVTSSGSPVTFTSTDANSGLFTVTQDGKTVGALDCSTLDES